MEILVGIAVVFILLICLGASVQFMIIAALALMFLFVIFMTAIFIYAGVVLIKSKRRKGFFLRSQIGTNSKIPFAYYSCDGVEYKNMFPLEVIFKKKIYRNDVEVPIFINSKKKCCFDINAVMCCILGIIVSLFLSGVGMFLLVSSL